MVCHPSASFERHLNWNRRQKGCQINLREKDLSECFASIQMFIFSQQSFQRGERKLFCRFFLPLPDFSFIWPFSFFYKPKFPTLLPQYSDFRKCDDKVNGVAMHYSFPLDISHFLASNTGCPLCPDGQDWAAILLNTGFNKYCVFSKIFKYIPDSSSLSRFPLGVSVCT